MATVAELQGAIAALPREDKAELFDFLLDHLGSEIDDSVMAEWKVVVQARLESYRRGEVELIPASEVLKRRGGRS